MLFLTLNTVLYNHTVIQQFTVKQVCFQPLSASEYILSICRQVMLIPGLALDVVYSWQVDYITTLYVWFLLLVHVNSLLIATIVYEF